MLRALAWTICLAGLASAQAVSWYVAKSEHFLLYTEESGQAAGLLGEFERAYTFFDATHQLNPVKGADRTVLLLALHDEAVFERYRIGESTTAYFLTTDDFDGVVMGPVAQRERRAAVHEYVHLRIQRAGLKMPVWLNEGMAEYYSTLKIERQGQASTGEVIPAHLKNLSGAWIPFDALFALGARSSTGFYQHAHMALTAYSECWAAAHMLVTEQPYRARFPEFLNALSKGLNSQQSFEQVYHIAIPDFEQAVRAYTRHMAGKLILYHIAAYRNDIDARPAPADDFTVSFALASAFPDRLRRITAMEQLAGRYPQRPEPQVTLAYQYWRTRGVTAAIPSFQHAYENGTGNTAALWDYGKLLLNMRDPRCPLVLNQVVKAWPDRGDARFLLAQWYLMNRQFEEALKALEQMTAPPPGPEVPYYEAVVVTSVEMGQYGRARQVLDKLGAMALTPEQRSRFELYRTRAGQ
jgi:tetratricopeptide (TPR) repeat protein